MKKIIISLAIITSTAFSNEMVTVSFNEAKVTYKPLSSFTSLEDFEKSYKEAISRCKIDYRPARSCDLEEEIWDKELNYYYKALMNRLNPKDKKLLKVTQRKWLKYYNNISKNIGKILDYNYPIQGTMYRDIRSDDYVSIMSKLKQDRTLFFKDILLDDNIDLSMYTMEF
ncbi:hypothetical protein MNB_SV-15-149 [hydrothermal vent metagenome]|uniref:Lysozyme inhibitor LprI-like N-terminal domain-containing protein n=1 Tax=hydrothermal vent metagenome TaxID=652676 RepID=A0A1W1ELD8_9ZZZZ